MVEGLHKHIKEMHSWRKRELAERAELEERESSLSGQAEQLHRDVQALEAQVNASREDTARVADEKEVAERQCDQLKGHVTKLTAELEARHNMRQAELSAVEERYLAAADEGEAAKSRCQFLEERQRQFEDDCCRLEQEKADLTQEVATLSGQLEALQVALCFVA